jgi:hypothetical protein
MKWNITNAALKIAFALGSVAAFLMAAGADGSKWGGN